MNALVVDDERNMRLLLGEVLAGEGYRVHAAASAEEALEMLESGRGEELDLALLDLKLPGKSGLDLLESMRAAWPSVPAVILTAHGTIDAAVASMQRGAFDFLVKPVDVARVRELVARVRGSNELMGRASLTDPRVEATTGELPIVGAGTGLKEVIRTIHKVAATDASVLITGESGTGKELIAHALHSSSSRKEGPFVSINCAALPESLLESELFGFEKGSFTGAHARKLGTFEIASGGTLFLDEIGDMALPLQAKILRALQERKITRIGGGAEIDVDVRLISATNQNLEEAIARDRFRADLYYRLNVIPIALPALRERREDIPALVAHFAGKSCARHGRPALGFSPAALARLTAHDWPGNIRELENTIEKAVLLGEEAMVASLPPPRGGAVAADPATVVARAGGLATLKEATEEAQRRAIVAALEHAGGNKRQAARTLGVSYKTLFNKLKELGIQTGHTVEVA